MVTAMLLAHLVGDFILQFDSVARWKSESFTGVVVHSLIVTAVTLLFGLAVDPAWWPWLLVISFAHFVIDSIGYYRRPPIKPLYWFLIDQSGHLLIIFAALVAGGILTTQQMSGSVGRLFQNQDLMLLLLGYAFLTMPAWVTLKFISYGLIDNSGPRFLDGTNRYVGMIERMLVATFVLTGQYLLIPLAAAPRLLFDWPLLFRRENRQVYFFEAFASTALAVCIGLMLRWI